MVTIYVPKKVEFIPCLRREIKRVLKWAKEIDQNTKDLQKALDLLKNPIKDKYKVVGKVFGILADLDTSYRDEFNGELWEALAQIYW